ncbi:MAG: hypothetical protein HC838_15045 [Spirulinaceae cyanobacterium RM2_2_10]|nr:hypothetical protein [Spirulinaceae cyanobacterium SM2_1_0]NJO21082.1 hypothetical protein [Spirulinaceae cyanobacterium RM2_2_10]
MHPQAKASERVQRLRSEYWEVIRDIRVEGLVLLGESGVNLGLIRLFAWAMSGQRAYGAQPKRGRNVSLVAGLSLAGVVASAVILGAFESLSFEAFVAT